MPALRDYVEPRLQDLRDDIKGVRNRIWAVLFFLLIAFGGGYLALTGQIGETRKEAAAAAKNLADEVSGARRDIAVLLERTDPEGAPPQQPPGKPGN